MDKDTPSLFARMFRNEREASGLTRKDAAEKLNMSKQLIYLLERKAHPPSPETLQTFFRAFKVPRWRQAKFLAVAHPQYLNQMDWELSPIPTRTDQLGLDRMSDPACFHDPGFDLYAANQRFLDVFPGIPSPTPTGDVRPNLLVWVVTDPRAKEVIQNWRQRAGVMVDAFLTVAPDRVPQSRIDEIIAACRAAPGSEFDEMSKVKSSDADIFDQTIILMNPDTGEWERRTITAKTFKYPPKAWDELVLRLQASELD
ncbi:helix-turn-helix domain-containing protein [Nocardia sp. NBC_01009]|uniref:MmyB family transcriptional regulator n=1 Tax=Nocardia sp. NBC_01009 TaxID=2975996 RepID=UPI00386D04EC|nr:helix-turn-helix transcriptional regulator [Nocardia sp. NBC_01009]